MNKTTGIFLLTLFVFQGAMAGDPLADGLGKVLQPLDDSRWSIVDGLLAPERGDEFAYIVSTERYSDVEITLSFKPEAGTNSGVFTRCQDPQKITADTCYEVNIWDATPKQESRTGAVFKISPPRVRVDTDDRWNTMRIRLQGPRLQVWINDTLVNDIEHDRLSEGHIALQYGGQRGMIQFRDMQFSRLD